MVRLSSDERKNEIILAALPVFAEKGLHATTTKEIARKANVSEALLYKHFKSKDEIYSQIRDFCCTGAHEVALNILELP
ncbi:TetR/AcrR family transcriptional regulator, partial [Bacteriovoracaceae bacterium]|nr:TetR/AcrR family transcriptional regulator [Bacteriovoracaceae bacterium]